MRCISRIEQANRRLLIGPSKRQPHTFLVRFFSFSICAHRCVAPCAHSLSQPLTFLRHSNALNMIQLNHLSSIRNRNLYFVCRLYLSRVRFASALGPWMRVYCALNVIGRRFCAPSSPFFARAFRDLFSRVAWPHPCAMGECAQRMTRNCASEIKTITSRTG